MILADNAITIQSMRRVYEVMTAHPFDLDEANRVINAVTQWLLVENDETLDITRENAIIQQSRLDSLLSAANNPERDAEG